jgi:hypothetical protein
MSSMIKSLGEETVGWKTGRLFLLQVPGEAGRTGLSVTGKGGLWSGIERDPEHFRIFAGHTISFGRGAPAMLGAGAHVRFREGVGSDVFRLIENNGYAANSHIKKDERP